MKVLLDHNMPAQIVPLLIGHEVRTTHFLGWTLLQNGHLIAAAEDAGFQVMLSGDKKMIRQYTNFMFHIGIVIVGNTTRDVLSAHISEVLRAIRESTPGSLTPLPMPGTRDFRKRNPRQES